MSTGYRESHTQPGTGRSYQAAFSNRPHRKMIWMLEKGILDQVLCLFYDHRNIQHLDFACGTGRILSHLESRTSSRVGVDVSASMLEVARVQCPSAEIVKADLTKSDELGDRKFNLITAFRFFPNAESALRTEVMRVLGKHLGDDGYLIFNNHKHTESTRNRLARLCGRRGFEGMSIAQTEELVRACGLEIVQMISTSILPASDKHLLLPIRLLMSLESILTQIKALRNLGENLVFVCRHARGVRRC